MIIVISFGYDCRKAGRSSRTCTKQFDHPINAISERTLYVELLKVSLALK